jgi:mRNA interferase RelE/StbE
MTMYQVTFVPHVEHDLKRLDRPVRLRILRKIEWLAENLEDLSPNALTGQWQGMYKLRVGDYRIIYTLDPSRELLIVHAIGHRSDVYTA